ncbi:ABC transporter ATP-binding protein [Giardia duodenalis]|uniref:ABC transporter ATP-binding protein n=1 Tax=Giardia intestinalis TaxID=5741 RepID=V6TP53_GIAIN|nr:ABC transporter ATP-binding protein [Giardia intestinalis]
MARKCRKKEALSEYKRPTFIRQILTCLYKQWLALIQSPQSYIIIFGVPVLTIFVLYIVQTAIYSQSSFLSYASTTSKDFIERFPSDTIVWPTCANSDPELIQKRCVDFAVCIADASDKADSGTKGATDLAQTYEIVNFLIKRHNLETVIIYDEDCSTFFYDLSDVLRPNDTVVALKFGALEKDSGQKPISIYSSSMRYQPKLTPDTRFVHFDSNRNMFVPVIKGIYEAFAVVYQNEASSFTIPSPKLVSWPHLAYNEYKPITMLVGMLVTLSSAALLSLLASMLLSDLSHPCCSLMEFLGLTVPARLIAWLIIAIPVAVIQPLMLYVSGIVMKIPLYSSLPARLGYFPLFVFSLTLIPTAMLISVCCSKNIAYPALPTNNPTSVATYIVGIITVMSIIILAPISSTVFKTSDVHSVSASINSIFGEKQEVGLPVKVTSYILRQINFAVGLACCSLGIIDSKNNLNSLGINEKELWWVLWDGVWMLLVAILITWIKIFIARTPSCGKCCKSAASKKESVCKTASSVPRSKNSIASHLKVGTPQLRLRSLFEDGNSMHRSSAVGEGSSTALGYSSSNAAINSIQLEDSTSNNPISRSEMDRPKNLHRPGEVEVLNILSDPVRLSDTLIIRNLVKRYKDFKALSGIDMYIGPGECICINGINGSGKSTLLHCIVHLEQYSSGRISYPKTIGFVSQYNTLWDNLTASQHIKLMLRARGLPTTAANVSAALEEVGLGGVEKRKVGQFSYGMKRRTCLAMALAGRPSLFLLDEVTSGVDPGSKEKIWAVIQRQQQQRSAVVLTSHSIRECEILGTRIVIMGAGKVAAVGSSSELKNSHVYGYSLTVEAVHTDGITSEQVMHNIHASGVLDGVSDAAAALALADADSAHGKPRVGKIKLRQVTGRIVIVELPKLPLPAVAAVYRGIKALEAVRSVALRSPNLEPIFTEYALLSERKDDGSPVSL